MKEKKTVGATRQYRDQSFKDEVVRLRREVLRLTEQRDLLKGRGILCEPPPISMPGSKP